MSELGCFVQLPDGDVGFCSLGPSPFRGSFLFGGVGSTRVAVAIEYAIDLARHFVQSTHVASSDEKKKELISLYFLPNWSRNRSKEHECPPDPEAGQTSTGQASTPPLPLPPLMAFPLNVANIQR